MIMFIVLVFDIATMNAGLISSNFMRYRSDND